MQKRIGMYAWGGPGTIRLLQTKYHQPEIDRESFLRLYDPEYLTRAQELFSVTDAWIAYSWGFSDQTELPDRKFVVKKLPNFQKLNIATHAYIQGFNVVTAEFSDVFCHDPAGHLLPYSKGRSFTCPNNPKAAKIILQRVEKACQEDFTGIFIDNIIFGLPPIFVSQNFVPFFGCACSHCKIRFQEEFGYDLPVAGLSAETLQDFLKFRVRSTERLIKAAHKITQQYHKQFGVNLYDPFLHSPALYFGYTLESLNKYLSYLLIENHAHPSRLENGNSHLDELLKKTEKTVFIVSYNNGIGFEKQFTQADIDAIWSDSETWGYSQCLKITEYTTQGLWHALRLEKLKPPLFKKKDYLRTENTPSVRLKIAKKWQIKLAKLQQNFVPTLLNFVYEHRSADAIARKLGFFQKQLWSVKNYDLE